MRELTLWAGPRRRKSCCGGKVSRSRSGIALMKGKKAGGMHMFFWGRAGSVLSS
jgi:hypothetical protein